MYSVHSCVMYIQGGRIFSVSEKGLKKLLSSGPIQPGKREVPLVNKQQVFFSTSNCTSCKEKDKLWVK